jgi:hypothetical protein
VSCRVNVLAEDWFPYLWFGGNDRYELRHNVLTIYTMHEMRARAEYSSQKLFKCYVQDIGVHIYST